MIRILAVFPDPDVAETVQQLLQGRLNLGSDVHVEAVRNESIALKQIDLFSYDLLVSDLYLPADRQSQIVQEEQRGLSLARAFRSRTQGPIVLVPAATTESAYQAAQQLERCWIVTQGGHEWEDNLVGFCARGLSGTLGDTIEDSQTPRLEIKLDPHERRLTWSLHGHGALPDPQELRMSDDDSDKLLELIERSKDLAPKIRSLYADNQPGEQWRGELKRIGKSLRDILFSTRNRPLTVGAAKLCEKAGGVQNIQLRFRVDPQIHLAVLEAVMDLEIDEYWMLRGPVVRCPSVGGSGIPLFTNSQSRQEIVNVLIIESNAAGVAYLRPGLTPTFTPLGHISAEAEELENDLLRNQESLRIGRIRRIKHAEEQRSFAQTVEHVLTTEGPWHIVHYAGHSIFDEKSEKGRGYVFFPAQGTDVQGVSVGVFSSWLRDAHTRFVYLSSCQSSEAGFIFEIARAGIPAILGFRWEVEDDGAAAHSKIFYKHLLGARRQLEHAFFKTRCELHQADEQNPTWASPMLIVHAGS